MEFCERHLPDTTGTPVVLFPIWDMGNSTWNERLATACDTPRQTYHAGWVFMVCYAQHESSLLHEVMTVGAYQHIRLKE
jgi:hypothetical protein